MSFPGRSSHESQEIRARLDVPLIPHPFPSFLLFDFVPFLPFFFYVNAFRACRPKRPVTFHERSSFAWRRGLSFALHGAAVYQDQKNRSVYENASNCELKLATVLSRPQRRMASFNERCIGCMEEQVHYDATEVSPDDKTYKRDFFYFIMNVWDLLYETGNWSLSFADPKCT